MGSVFNAVVVTGSRANAMRADMKDADFKKLNDKGMISPGAMPGPPGIDSTVIYGNCAEYVQGYRDKHITDYDKRQIDHDLFETTNLSCYQTYNTGHKLKVFSHEIVEIYGTRELTVTQEDTETYSVHREIKEPTKYEWGTFKMEATDLSIEHKSINMVSELSKVALTGIIAEVEMCHDKNEAIAAKIALLQTEGVALMGRIGGFFGKVQPSFDAIPTPTTITPLD